MSKTSQCSHEGCTCNIPSARKDGYCSDYCKAHSADPKHTAHECDCSHGRCGK